MFFSIFAVIILNKIIARDQITQSFPSRPPGKAARTLQNPNFKLLTYWIKFKLSWKLMALHNVALVYVYRPKRPAHGILKIPYCFMRPSFHMLFLPARLKPFSPFLLPVS